MKPMDSITCIHCRETKARSEFFRRGLRVCRSCKNRMAREKRARLNKTIRVDDFEQTCTDCGLNKPSKDFYRDSTKKRGVYTRCRVCVRISQATIRYGMTKEEVMMTLTTEKCDICSNGFKTTRDKCIDHDHGTGSVRGVLCRACNTGIGNFRDSPQLLERAILYLTGYILQGDESAS